MPEPLDSDAILNRVIAAYYKYLELQPEECQVWCQLGVALSRQSDPEATTQAFYQAQKYAPSEAWCCYIRSVEGFFTGRMQEAIKAQEKAKKLCPDTATETAWSELNLTFARQKTQAELVSICQKIVTLKPQDVKTWGWLAEVQQLCGQHEESAGSLRQILSLKPTDAKTWRALADVYGAQNLPENQTQALRQYLRLQPADVQEWRNLGSVLAWQNKPEEAVRAFQKALQLQPNDAELWQKLAMASGQLGDHQRELEAYRRCQELSAQSTPSVQLEFF